MNADLAAVRPLTVSSSTVGEPLCFSADAAFVFARGEPGIPRLHMQGGADPVRLGERCRIHIIDSADHPFSQSVSRTALEGVLSDALSARGGAVDVVH
jgi:hypothetical protein